MSLVLSAPQNIFINGLKTKNTAYVGGFGCMHPDTRVHTEFGLMRIADITSSIRVLSWNEKDQRFQLSLSGGSYPKGRANLYRVATQQGEFVASGHHRTLSSCGNYLPVQDLCEGDEVATFGQLLPDSNLALCPKSLTLDAEHCNQTNEDYLRGYADAARLYGLLLHEAKESDLAYAPLSVDVRKSALYDDLLSIVRKDDLSELKLERIRLDLLTCLLGKSRLALQMRYLSLFLASRTSTSCVERTCDYHQQSQQSALMFDSHCSKAQSSSVFRSYDDSSIKSTKILSVSKMDVDELYYDLQVLDTNNYVTEDGCIHHNSGKTFVACLKILIYIGRFPLQRWGFWAPSYPLIRDVFYPTFEEAAHMMGFTVKVNKGDKEVNVYRGGVYYGTVICRSMSDPSSIVGYKVAGGICDEIDTMKMDKAQDAWRKVNARLRLSVKGLEQNWLGVTTTPEGFNFVYKTFAKDPKSRYSMVQASTYENRDYLPDDYIGNLFETYPENLIEAYLNGEFVNLTGGTVYKSYDPKLNNSTEVVTESDKAIYIGMDFNVTKMAARVFVKRGNDWHIVDEFCDLYDTPDMIENIQMRYPDKLVYVYPDASGDARKPNSADVTDIKLLKAAGFRVRAKDANPRVKTRINSVNAMFCNAKGERRLFVNQEKCPVTHDDLQQQVYNDKGDLDKRGDADKHGNDALGYLIAYECPIKQPVSKHRVKFGGYQ